MTGVKYLLDTNIILGLLKSDEKVAVLLRDLDPKTGECGYSGITRMELLGYPGITVAEATVIAEALSAMVYLPVTRAVEDTAIKVRQTTRLKLPDAIICATAIVHNVELLTFDTQLDKAFKALPAQP